MDFASRKKRQDSKKLRSPSHGPIFLNGASQPLVSYRELARVSDWNSDSTGGKTAFNGAYKVWGKLLGRKMKSHTTHGPGSQ